MRLNVDCVRDTLLELEKLPFQTSCTIEELTTALPKYNADDIAYTCFKLAEADYIIIQTYQYISMSSPCIRSIDDITFHGHEFLNNIHSDNVWSTVKNVSSKVGSHSISAITQIAIGVVTEIIKTQLPLFF